MLSFCVYKELGSVSSNYLSVLKRIFTKLNNKVLKMNKNQNNSSSSNGSSNKRDQGLYPFFLGRPGNTFSPSESAKDSRKPAQNCQSNDSIFDGPHRSGPNKYNSNNIRRSDSQNSGIGWVRESRKNP